MIAEALKFLARIQTPQRPSSAQVDGNHYRINLDGTLGEVIRPVAPIEWPTFKVSTLGGIIELHKRSVDNFSARTALHVVDPFTVNLVSLLADDFGRRHVYAQAVHSVKLPFEFAKYYEPEPFLIAFRAAFLFNEEAVKVQTVCSSISAGNAVNVADDGVSQQVTLVNGTITRANITIPADGISLIPVRTFREANAVESKFLLRMKGVKDALPHIALFEIDAFWQLDTVNAIAKYLAAELPDAIIIR